MQRAHGDRVEPLLGRAGSAYLFDTNMLHRGSPAAGLHRRDSYLFEFAGVSWCIVRVASLRSPSHCLPLLLEQLRLEFVRLELPLREGDDRRRWE